MEAVRLQRYNEEKNVILESLVLFSKEPQSELEKRGVLYSIQIAIGSLNDILAMLNKDLGLNIKDDDRNIIQIIQKFNLDADLGEKLIKINEIRFSIVKRYDEIKDSIIFRYLDEISIIIKKWLGIMEDILASINNK